jgi:uncharacterized membrane protein
MIALLALGGCGKRTPPESRDRTAAADSTAARVPKAAAPIDSVIVALGNEPFWNVRVTPAEILYRDPEHQDGSRFPPVAAIQEGAARIYRTKRDLPAGDPGPRILELRIRWGPCSDGMSDRQYSMSASLKLDDVMLSGCAMFQPDTGQARTGGQ